MGLFKTAFDKIRNGLAKTRSGFVSQIRTILTGKRLSPQLLEDLETRMIQADVGVATSRQMVQRIREAWQAGQLDSGDQALEFLKDEMVALWPDEDRKLRLEGSVVRSGDEVRGEDGANSKGGPTVILVAGINGAGKTTSIAKIAKSLRDEGKSVMLAACDTFRAAAVEQLEIWSKRLDVMVIKGQQGGDPAAVAFDACDAAVSRGVDVLLVDTAGRLHTQDPLMRQLTKIKNVCAKKIPDAPHEVLLVLDATIGQNAIQQAKVFTEAIDVTGLFLAKLDGTAKGGMVVAIREQLDIPVKFIGVGETPDDVEPFDPKRFVEALFAE